MANTINRDRLDILNMALGEYGNTFNEVSVTCERSRFNREKPLEWKVNWSAIGAVTVEETAKFAAKLARAAEIARALNAMEMIAEPKDDEELDERFKENEDDAREYYERFIKIVSMHIECNEWGHVEYLLLNR